MPETVERKPFKSIHIDIDKGICLLNGEALSMVPMQLGVQQWEMVTFNHEG